MANGFLSRFQGKIKVAQLWLASSSTSAGEGGVYDNASGIRLGLGGALRLPMTVTATTTTNYSALKLPVGAAIESLTVYTTTAFTGGTATLTIGSASGGAQYVASVSVAAAGVVVLSPVASAACAAALLAAPAAGFFATITQASAPTAVGAATLVVAFDLA